MEETPPAISELSQNVNGAAEISPPANPETVEVRSRFDRLLSATRNIGHLATRGSQTALVLLQVSPANEVVRFGAFGAGEAMTHSPAMGALTYGLSTLGVEVAGTLAGAPLLDSAPSERITNFLNRKLSRVTADGETQQREYSRTTKLSTAFIGGTVPAMALEKLEDPSRTAEHNRRYGLWTSTWLAGACAVQGAAMSEGIDLASNNTKMAAIAGGVAATGAAAGWLKRRIRANRVTKGLGDSEDYDESTGVSFHIATDNAELQKAKIFEQSVWNEKGYGNLQEYEAHIKQARTFTAFEGEDCVGLLRLFGGRKNLPPFTNFPFTDKSERKQIIKDSKKGFIEEVGTIAVKPELRNKSSIGARLERLAYRDARARGIQAWGIIMEPERVKKMNELYGFTFKQVGPAIEYQGGMC